MTKSKHTPGPILALLNAAPGTTIEIGDEIPATKAWIREASAAPDLLAALEECAAMFEGGSDCGGSEKSFARFRRVSSQALTAIARAKGGSDA